MFETSSAGLLLLLLFLTLFIISFIYQISGEIFNRFFINEDNDYKTNLSQKVIFLLLIAFLFLFCSIIAVPLFTRSGFMGFFDPEKTGYIGDTIGGITNPFINSAAVVVTGLAFYMQYKANKLQVSIFKKQLDEAREQFDKSLKEDRLKDIRIEKLDSYHKLELLIVNLNSILEDINEKGEKILKFGQDLHDEPYKSHILKRTPSRDYLRILEIDRLAVYKGFRFFNVNEQSKNFSRLYNILDFLPEFFQDFYSKVQNYIKESFDEKMNIRSNILQFLDYNANVIINYEDNQSHPVAILANEAIRINYEIIEASYDEFGNPVSETDWQEIDEKLLKNFIEKALKLRGNIYFDPTLIPIIEFASNIRKDIILVKQRAIEFSSEVITQYNNLLVDGEQDSIGKLLANLQTEINDGLLRAKLEVDIFYKV
jgi:ABC-type multidrug transport system fused ATPase/permease subunit